MSDAARESTPDEPGGILEALRRRSAAVWMVTALLVVMGVAAVFQMPSSIYPEVEFPRIVVVAKSGAAPPDVFVATTTRPLETALSSVMGLSRIRSKTVRGATQVSLDFAPDTDMWRALQLVEAAVSEARAGLPDKTTLVVEKVTTGSFPVVTFNLAGPVDPRALREAADLVVEPAFASTPGVGRVDVVGGDEREIEVVVDPEKLSSLGMSADDAASRIEGAFGTSAVGRALDGAAAVTVLADAEPKRLADISAIPLVTTDGGGIVTLGAVAEVIDGHKDRTARVGGPDGETVAISVARLPQASTAAVVRRIEEVARELAPLLPKGASLRPVYDQAILVDESMASVRDAIIIGVLLCLVVISLSLRDPRAGLVHSASIPVTLAMTFLVMRVFGQTLNLMSLGGMAVAIGIVIDDAIVIVESIARHKGLGKSPLRAARDGTKELAPAVIGTTTTTVVVFLPLAFLGGVVGDFFRALAFTVVTAVVLSMLVALILVPLAAGVSLSSKHEVASPPSARVYRLFAWLSKRSIAAVAALVGMTALLAIAFPRLPSGFLPQMDEGGFVLDYFLPAGSSLEETDRVARKIEKLLGSVPEVEIFARRSGAELGPATATELSRGDVMVRLVPRTQRKRSVDDVIAELRGEVEEQVPEARVEFVQVLKDVLDDLGGNPRPVELKLFGRDPVKLAEAADAVAKRIDGVSGLVDLFDGREREGRELRFTVKRDAIARFDAKPSDIASALSTALDGRIVGQVRKEDRFIDVRVRYPDPVRLDPPHVRDLPFVRAGHATSFAAVTDLAESTEPSVRLHEALGPVLSVTGDHAARDLGSVGRDIDARLAGLKLPEGVRLVVAGQVGAERATVKSLLEVGGAALLLVLAVLAAQFRRFRLALLSLAGIPVALLGGALALLVTGSELNASSMMGFVLLVGLVVKNAVLLLEEAERRIDAGEAPDHAVASAAQRRLRPILMTTSATIVGLFPLALGLGAGAEIQQPLAIAVVGGLALSTVGTLALIPGVATLILRRAPVLS